MPANTFNRGYPYPLGTDPANVPQALQDLAEEIDQDIAVVAPTVGARPVAHVSGSSPQQFGASGNTVITTFQQINVSIGGAVTSIENFGRRVYPKLPGFYWVTGVLVYPRASSPTAVNTFGIIVRGTQGLVQQNTHFLPTTTQENRTITASTGIYFNGTSDYVQLEATLFRASPISRYTIGYRSLTLLRMTEG